MEYKTQLGRGSQWSPPAIISVLLAPLRIKMARIRSGSADQSRGVFPFCHSQKARRLIILASSCQMLPCSRRSRSCRNASILA